MKSLPVLTCLAALAALSSASAATTPAVEISGFGSPALGSDFKGHTGFGVSAATTAAYDFSDSHYGEQLLAQAEGLYLHSSGTNAIGGPSHREDLDAGFGMLNGGLGTRTDHWGFAVYVGAGFGGGSLSGNTAAKDLSLDFAFQVKPRVTWYFARNWSAFLEYRYFRTADAASAWFDGDKGRQLSMHAFGLGAAYSF